MCAVIHAPQVQIWDAARGRQVRELAGHTNRVSCVAWNGSLLSSGGRDAVIANWDVRKKREEACVGILRCHEQASRPHAGTARRRAHRA